MSAQQPAQYVYPDEGDLLTQLLIEETGRVQAWSDEEQAVLLDLAHSVLEVKPAPKNLNIIAHGSWAYPHMVDKRFWSLATHAP